MGDSLISSAKSYVISDNGRNCDVVAEAGGDVVRILRRCSVACFPPRGIEIWPLLTICPSMTGVMSTLVPLYDDATCLLITDVYSYSGKDASRV